MNLKTNRFNHPKYWLPIVAVFFLWATLTTPGAVCIATAQSTPANFCYVTEITVTNNSGGTLTDYPVRVELNAQALIASGQLDPRAWDMRAYIGSYGNEISIEAGDLGDGDAPFWFIIPSIADGEAQTIKLHTSNAEVQRDQGWRSVTTDDDIQVADAAALNLVDDFVIEVVANVRDDSSETRQIYLFDKSVGLTGYSARKRDSSGVKLSFILDNTSSCELAWDDSWSNKDTLYHFRYIAAAGTDAFIEIDGTPVASCDTDEGSLTPGSTALGILTRTDLLGDSVGTTIRDFKIWQSGTLILHHNYDPQEMIETSAVNPSYSGTHADLTGNGHTGTWNREVTQTGITTSVATTRLVTLQDFGSVSSGNSIVGAPSPGDLSDRPFVNTGILYTFFYTPVSDTASASSLPLQGVLLFTVWAFSVTLGGIVLVFSRFMPVVVVVMGVPYGIAVGNGWVSPIWLLLWVVTVAVVWLATERLREASA